MFKNDRIRYSNSHISRETQERDGKEEEMEDELSVLEERTIEEKEQLDYVDKFEHVNRFTDKDVFELTLGSFMNTSKFHKYKAKTNNNPIIRQICQCNENNGTIVCSACRGNIVEKTSVYCQLHRYLMHLEPVPDHLIEYYDKFIHQLELSLQASRSRFDDSNEPIICEYVVDDHSDLVNPFVYFECEKPPDTSEKHFQLPIHPYFQKHYFSPTGHNGSSSGRNKKKYIT